MGEARTAVYGGLLTCICRISDHKWSTEYWDPEVRRHYIMVPERGTGSNVRKYGKAQHSSYVLPPSRSSSYESRPSRRSSSSSTQAAAHSSRSSHEPRTLRSSTSIQQATHSSSSSRHGKERSSLSSSSQSIIQLYTSSNKQQARAHHMEK